MAYVTKLGSGSTTADIADKDLYGLRTSANANKYVRINSDGDGIEVGAIDCVANSQGSTNANKVLVTDSDGDVTTGYLQSPVGAIIWFGGSSAPDGFLLCNGAAVSRTTYADLFSAIGTTYGTGDGSTTFNLPNLIDKFIEGSGTPGTSKTESITVPSHYHYVGYNNNNNGGFLSTANKTRVTPTVVAGYTQWNGSGDGGGYSSGTLSCNIITSYQTSSSGSTTVQPPALTMLPLVRY